MVSYFDLILLIPFGLAIWRGWKNGLVMEIFSSLALFVGLYAGIHFSDWMADILHEHMDIKAKNLPIVSFITVFILVIIGLFFLGKLITKSVKAGGAERWNQVGGSVLSLGKTLLYLSVFFMFFHTLDSKYGLLPKEQREKSLFYKPVQEFSLVLLPSIKESDFYKRLKIEAQTGKLNPKTSASNN